jgi:formate hydrogenlyase transcriptional activator
MSQHPPDNGGRQVHRYEAPLEVLESISRHGDLARRLRPVVPFEVITVLLHDPADVMRLHILEAEHAPGARPGPDFSPVESPGGWVWQTQQPMVIPDYEQEARFPRPIPVWRALGLWAGCYLPLSTAQRRLGTINFASIRPRAYEEGDLHFFGQVARQVAVAVDNALNFERAQCYAG